MDTDSNPRGTKRAHVDISQDAGENCVRLRPEEDGQRLSKVSTRLVGRMVSPFLREHIPGAYSSVDQEDGVMDDDNEGVENVERKDVNDHAEMVAKNPNSRHCYRHRPDSKYRRAADERKMAKIQSSLSVLPLLDQQAITTVWSLFSAAPARHRQLMLEGIVIQSCFSQLSTMASLVSEQLKIDFLAALPRELGIMVLTHLDTASLCRAAQVSRHWRHLSEDDQVWKHMCRQHIAKKCHQCGWGLPLLERRRLRSEVHLRRHQPPPVDHDSLTPPPMPPAPLTPKNLLPSTTPATAPPQEPTTMPWKSVYRDRYLIGSNWKKGRCTIKVLKGHPNGITCLQLDETARVVITGSYDTTIKVWNVDTGEELRTLTGHTRGLRSLYIDRSKLFSGALDGTVRVWNWRTGETHSVLMNQSNAISIVFKSDVLVTGSVDGRIRIWTFPKTGVKRHFSFRAHSDWVNQVRLDMDSRTILSSSDDGTVKLWDLDTCQCLRTFRGHVGHVQQVLPLPAKFEHDPDPRRADDHDNNYYPATPSLGSPSSPSSVGSDMSSPPSDSLPAGGDPSTCANIRTLYGPLFADSPSRPLPARHVLSGSLDNTVRLWDTASGRCIQTWFGHLEGIWGLEGDHLRVVTCAQDSMLKIWEPSTGRCVKTFTGHTGPVACVGISDTLLASGGGEDGELRLYCFSASPTQVGGF